MKLSFKNLAIPFAVLGSINSLCLAIAQPATTKEIFAKAQLDGEKVKGQAMFTQTSNKITIKINIQGAMQGNHGIHIHEGGMCIGPDFKSAGEHFKVGKQDHGEPKNSTHHAGDLGNISVDQDGKGTLSIEVPTSQFQIVPGASNSVIGKTLIIHEKPDDLKTQPSGNSGNRFSCGIIGTSTK